MKEIKSTNTNTTANANANNPGNTPKLKTEYFDEKSKRLDWFGRMEHKFLVLLGRELETTEEHSAIGDQYKIVNGPEGTRKELVQRGTPAYRKVTFKANPAFPAKVSRFKTKIKKLFRLLVNLVKGIIICCLGILGFIILMLTLRHFVPELVESMKAAFDFIESWALPMVNRAFKLATEWLCEHFPT